VYIRRSHERRSGSICSLVYLAELLSPFFIMPRAEIVPSACEHSGCPTVTIACVGPPDAPLTPDRSMDPSSPSGSQLSAFFSDKRLLTTLLPRRSKVLRLNCPKDAHRSLERVISTSAEARFCTLFSSLEVQPPRPMGLADIAMCVDRPAPDYLQLLSADLTLRSRMMEAGRDTSRYVLLQVWCAVISWFAPIGRFAVLDELVSTWRGCREDEDDFLKCCARDPAFQEPVIVGSSPRLGSLTAGGAFRYVASKVRVEASWLDVLAEVDSVSESVLARYRRDKFRYVVGHGTCRRGYGEHLLATFGSFHCGPSVCQPELWDAVSPELIEADEWISGGGVLEPEFSDSEPAGVEEYVSVSGSSDGELQMSLLQI
jgi:hypothetical protein